jgi:TolB-like protein
MDAGLLLEGTTRHHGARVRITARLVETDTEVQLWSETYDRIVDRPMSVQVEVAGSMARALIKELVASPAIQGEHGHVYPTRAVACRD